MSSTGHHYATNSDKPLATDPDGHLEVVMAEQSVIEAVIALNQSQSDIIPLTSRTLGAILMPAAWTAADMTFLASVDGENFFSLLDAAGVEVTLAVAADNFKRLTLADWQAIPYLKLRSGTSGVPVAQLAARTIKVVLVAAP